MRSGNRLIRMFMNASLQRKITLLASIVIFLAVPLTGAFSYTQASAILEDYAYSAADRTAGQLGDYLQNELANVSSKLYFINSSDAMKQTLEWLTGKSDENYSIMYSKLFSLFSQIRLTTGAIKTIYMYSPKGEFYEGLPIEKKQIPFKSTPLYEAIKQSPTNVWVYSKEDPLFAGEGDVLSLVTRPIGIGYLDEDTYLVITLSLDKFRKYLQSIQLVPQGFSVVVDGRGQPIMRSSDTPETMLFLEHMEKENIADMQPYFEMASGGGKVLVNHRAVPLVGWQAVVVQPKDRLLEKVNYIKYFTIVMTTVLLVAAFFINHWIARWVTIPLRKLQRLMNRASDGDLSVRFSSVYKDEIGKLGIRFDEMLEQIQQLLKQVVAESEAKQNAEMRALQAQINPHFLYNTLDELYWKSLDFQDKEAADLILSLSRFFRLSLNRGEDKLTVSKELEHVEHYLKLVSVQYKRQFTYEIVKDERADAFTVPKIILQPLVENSILHAFGANRYEDSRIRVESRFEEPDMLVLEVSDNGRGLTPEQLARFNAPLGSEPQPDGGESQGYAIRNVKDRLWYSFGSRASFRAESIQGEGARFEIRIKAEAGGQVAESRRDKA